MPRGRADASTSTDDMKARPLRLFYFSHPFAVLSPEPPAAVLLSPMPVPPRPAPPPPRAPRCHRPALPPLREPPPLRARFVCELPGKFSLPPIELPSPVELPLTAFEPPLALEPPPPSSVESVPRRRSRERCRRIESSLEERRSRLRARRRQARGSLAALLLMRPAQGAARSSPAPPALRRLLHVLASPRTPHASTTPPPARSEQRREAFLSARAPVPEPPSVSSARARVMPRPPRPPRLPRRRYSVPEELMRRFRLDSAEECPAPPAPYAACRCRRRAPADDARSLDASSVELRAPPPPPPAPPELLEVVVSETSCSALDLDEYVSSVLIESLDSLTDRLERLSVSRGGERTISVLEKEIKVKIQNAAPGVDRPPPRVPPDPQRLAQTQFSPPQLRTSQFSPPQQYSVLQIGPPQCSPPQLGPSQYNSPQIVGLSKYIPPQLEASQYCPQRLDPTQLSPPPVDPTTTEGSPCASLVDSLDDPRSPRAPPPAAFFVGVGDEERAPPESVSVADAMPESIKRRLHARQLRREQRARRVHRAPRPLPARPPRRIIREREFRRKGGARVEILEVLECEVSSPSGPRRSRIPVPVRASPPLPPAAMTTHVETCTRSVATSPPGTRARARARPAATRTLHCTATLAYRDTRKVRTDTDRAQFLSSVEEAGPEQPPRDVPCRSQCVQSRLTECIGAPPRASSDTDSPPPRRPPRRAPAPPAPSGWSVTVSGSGAARPSDLDLRLRFPSDSRPVTRAPPRRVPLTADSDSDAECVCQPALLPPSTGKRSALPALQAPPPPSRRRSRGTPLSVRGAAIVPERKPRAPSQTERDVTRRGPRAPRTARRAPRCRHCAHARF